MRRCAWIRRGTLDSVTVELRHGGELEARTIVQRITTQPRRVVLSRRGRPLAPGRYTLVVRDGHAVVARHEVRVAARTASSP
jgi:hypothetical protein